MATATFDRSFVIDTPEAQENLLRILAAEDEIYYSKKDDYVYTDGERRRSDELLKQCLSRFKG